MDQTRYQSVEASPNAFNNEYGRPKSSKSKWIVIGSLVGIVALIAIGVGVGVSVHNNSKKSTKALSASSSSDSSAGDPVQSDPNDPSTFQLDSRFKKAFYGLAYTPEGSQLPDCGNSLANVIKDVQIMSQLTTRIRLYGADCNQSALVLEAIKQTKVNMQVFLGNYPIPDDNTPYTRQRDLIKSALQTYGTANIAGVTVGNEFILNYLNDHGGIDPNDAIGNAGATQLIADITDTRAMIASLNLDKTIPVGNSDAGSFFNTKVLEASDYGLANVHPWFANTTIDNAAAWTNQFFSDTDVKPAAALPNQPKMYIAETGWPTKSSDAANANNGASDASVANLQIFLNTFVCQANTANVPYFFFEFFDEAWKDVQFGGVEGWWGLFNADRTLKAVTIPDCIAP
ncbi:glycoside hydrolase family 17 protein [Mycena floridula]|nr:glycoside hydrolase family 17 protein [Mycena floridula]